MKPVSLDDYFKRSGDTELTESQYKIDSKQHGFFSYDISGDTLTVIQMYGNMKHWEQVMVDEAKKHGCKKILAGTWRNGKAMARLFKAKIIATGTLLEREV